MATPAAILQIAVEANTRTASSQLTTLDRKLTAIDKTTATATTRTSALGSASKTAGSHLASAARYAAGAAAAYISISQAKAAVSTTQDLAKATLGLQKNLGLAGRDAGEWAAAASSRGVDTTKLGMAFKTLSTQVEAARGGSADAKKMFDGLGISMKDLDAGSRDVQGLMLQIADGMDKAGAGTSRMNDVSKLFGRSYAGIAPLIRDGSDALKENLQQTEKYGAALHGQTLADQAKLRSSLIESKTAWMGLQVTFTKFVTPALEAASESFQKVSRIMADDKLTDEAKFQKIGEIISGWASKALDAFVGILPTMVSKAGEAAPKIAGALVQGFIEAPIWGKVFLAGWLLKAMGGLKMAAAAGASIGSTMAAAIGARIAATAAWSSLAGTLAMFAPLMAPVGVAMGVAILGALSAYLGTKFAPVLERVMNVSDITKKISADFNVPIDKAQQVVDFMKAHPGLGAEEALNRMDRSIQHTSWVWGNTIDNIKGDTRSGVDVIAGQFSRGIDFGDKMGHMVKDLGVDFTLGMDVIKSATRGAVDVVAQQFARGIDAGKKMEKEVSASIDSLAQSVAKGFGNIAGMTNKALAAFGVKSVAFSIAQGFDKGSGHQRGGIIHAAMGALVPGHGSGDKVPAMLEPGEVVINRKAVAAMGGAGKANRVNSMYPRFASGGVIEQALGPYTIPPIQYDPNHAGGNSHVHADFFTVAQALAYGHKMQGMGWSIGEYTPHPSNPFNFGPITTQHQSPGHYDGTAFDANQGLQESRSAVAAVAKLFNGGGVSGVVGAVAEKIARQVLKGPDGPLKSIGQGALDKVRSAANSYLAKQAPKMSTTSMDGGAYKGPLDKVFPHPTSVASPGVALSATQVGGLASKAGLARGLFTQIAQGESGFHPGIVGYDPGGTRGLGLWQITTGFNDDIINRFGGESQMFNPWVNAQTAKAIFDRQGQGAWVGYQGGGVAKLARGGSPWAEAFIRRGAGRDIGATGSPFAQAQMAHNKLPRKWEKQLAALRGAEPGLEEAYNYAAIVDTFSTSPGGSELSAGELSSETGMVKAVLNNLYLLSGVLKKGIDWLLPGKMRDKLSAERAGLYGSSGTILTWQQTLDSLTGTTSTGSAGMSISDLVSLAQTVRYQSLPVMHGGGTVPGAPGTNVPIMAQAGETVTPAGGGAMLFDIYIGGEKIAEHVQAEIRKSDRASHEYFRAAPV